MLVYILLVAIAITCFFKSKISLHMLQQNLYNENNRYLKWVFKNYQTFISLEIIAIILSIFLGYKAITGNNVISTMAKVDNSVFSISFSIF